jgi:hypothetical protein
MGRDFFIDIQISLPSVQQNKASVKIFEIIIGDAATLSLMVMENVIGLPADKAL